MTNPLPKVWGHRGGDVTQLENTMNALRGGLLAGADGIESDVRITKDNVVIIHHDPGLGRIYRGAGPIATLPFHGYIDQLVTIRKPHLPVPTFSQVIAMIMEPAFQHVSFNIDVKPENDPERLFSGMFDVISFYPDYETLLCPRLVFGLWHPKHLDSARKYLPSVRITHLGINPKVAREIFWDKVVGFSMNYSALMTADGKRFCKECKAAGKILVVWTINSSEAWSRVTKLGIDVVITDRVADYLVWRNSIQISTLIRSSNTNPFFWLAHAALTIKKNHWQTEMLKACCINSSDPVLIFNFDKDKTEPSPTSSGAITPPLPILKHTRV